MLLRAILLSITLDLDLENALEMDIQANVGGQMVHYWACYTRARIQINADWKWTCQVQIYLDLRKIFYTVCFQIYSTSAVDLKTTIRA